MPYKLTIQYGSGVGNYYNTRPTIEEALDLLSHHDAVDDQIWKASIVEVDKHGNEIPGDVIYYYQNGLNRPRETGSEVDEDFEGPSTDAGEFEFMTSNHKLTDIIHLISESDILPDLEDRQQNQTAVGVNFLLAGATLLTANGHNLEDMVENIADADELILGIIEALPGDQDQRGRLH